jgi:hypothetical protein
MYVVIIIFIYFDRYLFLIGIPLPLPPLLSEHRLLHVRLRGISEILAPLLHVAILLL